MWYQKMAASQDNKPERQWVDTAKPRQRDISSVATKSQSEASKPRGGMPQFAS